MEPLRILWATSATFAFALLFNVRIRDLPFAAAGGGMYYMMLNSVEGNLSGMLSSGFQTAVIAGAIASGVAVVSAAVRAFKG